MTTFGSVCSVTPNLIEGENGALAHISPSLNYEDLDGDLVEIFQLLRNSEHAQDLIFSFFLKCEEILKKDSNLLSLVESKLVTLFKLILYIRNPRIGKGERDIVYDMIFAVFYHFYPKTDVAFILLDELHHHGSWKDYVNLYTETAKDDVEGTWSEDEESKLLKTWLTSFFVDQLKRDKQILESMENNPISLAGKWAPRETSNKDRKTEFAKRIASALFPSFSHPRRMKEYRKLISSLNKRLDTCEPKMCSKTWAEIDPSHVPSVNLTLHNFAFLNKKVNKFPKDTRLGVAPLRGVRNTTPLFKRGRRISTIIPDRHPIGTVDWFDRNKCKENFLNHINKGKKINAAVSELYKIVESYFNDNNSSLEEDPIYEAQWKKRIEEARELRKTIPLPAGSVSNISIFSLVDLSSSMSGQPMMVAITLGLFLSELLDDPLSSEPAYANKFMTFSTIPACMKLPRGTSLLTRIKEMKKYTWREYWGGSTNISAAISEILKIAIENKLTKDQLPRMLAIFSDMQFNVADSSWSTSCTSYQLMKKQFEEVGYDIPVVLFWNLRGDVKTFQVPTNTPDTIMLSGYSTRMFDLILEGNLEQLRELSIPLITEETTEEVIAVKTPVTSVTMMEKAIAKIDKFDPSLNERFLEALRKDLLL
jgi:hypothetical protein